MKDANLIQTVNGYNIVNDPKKGYVHVLPTPSEEELKKLYQIEYYANEKKDYIDNTLQDLEWWETIFKDKYETFEDNINAQNKKILDIGCGSGYFLQYGKERGWDGYGIEPSEKASLHAINNGLNVKNGSFKKELFPDTKFDVVHLNQVLEHIADPEQLMADVHQISKKESLLCISVPNEFSPLQTILHKDLNFKAWWLSPPHHLNYFTVDSLRQFISKNGYKVFLEETTFPMELFLLMGDNYIDNPTLGRDVHQKRKNFDINLSKHNNDFKRSFYQSLAKLNLGRTIIIYAKKVEK